MSFTKKPEDVLQNALLNGQVTVRLENVTGSLDNVFRKVLEKDRRLNAVLAGYQANYQKKGLLQLIADYEVELAYQEDAPHSIEEVLVDEHDFDAESLLTPGVPQSVALVTDDVNRIAQAMNDIMDFMLSRYEGLSGYNLASSRFEELTKDFNTRLTYTYMIPVRELRMYQSKAAFSAKSIWKRLIGKARVPDFVKAFLAFSYIMQTCSFDTAAYDEVVQNPKQIPSDPIPHLSYGPLTENRGICSGIAWAYKKLMDEVGIPCFCVSGYLLSNKDVGHMWNLVKLDGQYYHVDATWGLIDNENGVYVSGLLKPDMIFRKNHIWEEKRYPKATGLHYQYDFIEDFLYQHGSKYLDDGADDKIMFPENIVE